MKRATIAVSRSSSTYHEKAGRTSCVEVCAAMGKQRGIFDHLLPRKNQQVRSSIAASQVREDMRVVHETQLFTAVQILSQMPSIDSEVDGEISILSSLDVDDIMFEADRVHLELRPAVDLDVLRQYAVYLKTEDDEGEEEEDEVMM